MDEARTFASKYNLSVCPHGAGHPPGSYGVRYIPHKVLIGADGNIIRNNDGWSWSTIFEAVKDAAPSDAGGAAAAVDAESIGRVFAKYDTDGNGLIDRRELGDLLEELGIASHTDSIVGTILAKADADGSGRLDYAEFSAWICSAEAARVRRALGLASVGAEGGLPQCANGCGRVPYKHFPTCCRHCRGTDGPHGRKCNATAEAAGGGTDHARDPAKCRNGCGRAPFGDYPTCCTHCRGPDGPHARSCRGGVGGGGAARKKRKTTGSKEIASVFGKELVHGDGTKEAIGSLLGECKIVGIYFTAQW